MDLAYPDPELTDGVVRLRRWHPDGRDLDCIRAASTDARIPDGTTVPTEAEYTPDEGMAYIARQLTRNVQGLGISQAIAEAETDVAVGQLFLAVRPQQGVMGLGYWLVPSARRQGIGTRAAKLAADWVLTKTDTVRLEAWVEPYNEASQRLLLSAGFEREGLLRQFLCFPGRRGDAIVFSRLRTDQ